MALYHKWDVKNDFLYVLQFFSLISDGLGSVGRGRSSPDLGGHVNPISNRGSDYAHYFTNPPPLDFQTIQRPCYQGATKAPHVSETRCALRCVLHTLCKYKKGKSRHGWTASEAA